MPEKKCVKSCRSLQHCDGVMRFKQVENQSRNHALRIRKCCQCMLIAENGNSSLCVYRLQHPTTSYTGLMISIIGVIHISYFLYSSEKRAKHVLFLFLKEFLTRFLLHDVVSFQHLSLNVLLVKQICRSLSERLLLVKHSQSGSN